MKTAKTIQDGLEVLGRNELWLWAGLTVLFLSCLLLFWVIKSGFEAAAFNHVTGKSVSTWDALWIELRIIEGAE